MTTEVDNLHDQLSVLYLEQANLLVKLRDLITHDGHPRKGRLCGPCAETITTLILNKE